MSSQVKIQSATILALLAVASATSPGQVQVIHPSFCGGYCNEPHEATVALGNPIVGSIGGSGLWIEAGPLPVLASAAPPRCPGDVDGNGGTDVVDFAIFVANFGEGSHATRQQGDLTGDGEVDIFDFTIIVGDFGCDP